MPLLYSIYAGYSGFICIMARRSATERRAIMLVPRLDVVLDLLCLMLYAICSATHHNVHKSTTIPWEGDALCCI